RRTPGPDGSWNRRLPLAWVAVARPVYALALTALALLWATAGIRSTWLYEGGLVVAGMSAAAVIAYVVAAPGGPSARLLASPPVATTGRLSYSLYLWHWPVHVYAIHRWARLERPVLVAGELAATAALGVLSYALVERTTRRIRRPLVLAPPLLACGLLVLGSALLAHPAPPAERQSGVLVHGGP
ncbi:MAG: hypothetical protein QOG68_2216, partial [Solirubrobacteraceae bacterium]|nr:hypothetical protein [Solirubrobacteraceae bacterium]